MANAHHQIIVNGNQQHGMEVLYDTGEQRVRFAGQLTAAEAIDKLTAMAKELGIKAKADAAKADADAAKKAAKKAAKSGK